MIIIKNLFKNFTGSDQAIFNNLNLTIDQGDFCIIIGYNGSGKSTLLKLLSGEYICDHGDIDIVGKIAQVVQNVDLGTVPEMTLFENIALSFITRPTGILYYKYESQVIKILQDFNIGLEKYLHQPLKNLSGGQSQVIATLMALHSQADILLLDEHTSALDPKMQTLLMNYTAQKIKDLHLTSVMVTHNIDDAVKYGNRLIMLNHGSIVLDVRASDKRALRRRDISDLFDKYQDIGENYDN